MIRVSVCQVNLQKARLSSQLIQNKFQVDNYIGCITEPYTVANKVVFRPQGYKVIPEGTLDAVPRAALYIPRCIDSVILGHLCVPDCAVAQIKWEGRQVVLVSAYLDIELPVVQDWLSAIIQHVRKFHTKLVLTMDSNAHSSFYSSAQSNARGRALEDFIVRHMLQVQNQGDVPTFQSTRAQSIIDVTLTYGVQVWDWHVDDQYNASDHNSIYFCLEADKIPPREVRPWDKADWRKFTDVLDKVRPLPERITCKKLDREVSKLYSEINSALDTACPRYVVKVKKGKSEWYTDKIEKLHHRVRKQYKKAMNTEVDEEMQKYHVLRKKFRRRCRRAKNITWRTFVNSTGNQNDMALLSKIALHRDRTSLNVLYKADRTVTEPGIETIERLVEVHFPQATEFQQFPSHSSSFAITSAELLQKFEYVNAKIVRKSLLMFKPKKAPGPDQLKPIVFRYFPGSLFEYIAFLYKACLQLRYTPRLWQEATVVFIPKAGKKDQRECKAHRPIVLSNFAFKGLERVVTWQMDRHLKYYPIHPKQHGFQVGKGTEAALSSTCNYIEKFVLRRKYCLGVFLDITSAYDSMDIGHIRQSLYLHGAEEEIAEWYYQYLAHRVLHIPLHGETRSFVCGQGFPQGGVASAKFWILAFDPAIEIINRQFTLGNGYADDLSVVFGGNHPDELAPRVQRVIDELVDWGESCNLRFNPEKTVMVGFTRCTSEVFTVPICIKGVPLKFSQEAKYLGLLLDKRLTWKPHLLDKIAACKKFLLKMANIAHTTWGPKPHLMRWVYRCIVRPKLLYGALLWSRAAQKPSMQKRLRRLNRIGMNTYATVHRSTPSRGFEILTDTIPLHLYAKKSAVCAFVRLQNVLTLDWTGLGRGGTHIKSHLLDMKFATVDFGIENLMTSMDVCDIDRPVADFQVCLASLQNREAYLAFTSPYRVFTDGSKRQGRVGSAFVVFKNEERIFSNKFRLPDRSTVYQAEVYAIKEAALYMMLQENVQETSFFVDSQAAILSLRQERITSRTVLQAVRMLASIQAQVNIVWVPAHSGIVENELVDKLAKEACDLEYTVELPIPKCQVKNMVLDGIREQWKTEWEEYGEARMTKYFFPKPDCQKSKQIYNLSRLQLGRFVRIITGHNQLQYFQSKANCQLSPLCRFCNEDMETFHHFVFECPSLFHSRRGVFVDNLPDKDMNWSVSKLLEFSYLPHINRLLDPNSVHDIQLVDTDSEDEEEMEIDPDDI